MHFDKACSGNGLAQDPNLIVNNSVMNLSFDAHSQQQGKARPFTILTNKNEAQQAHRRTAEKIVPWQ